jgi:peroxin-11B
MKKSFGLARKVMRIGKFVEHFKAAAVAMDAKGMDPVLRYAAVGRQLGYAGYLTLDNISAVSTPLRLCFSMMERICDKWDRRGIMQDKTSQRGIIF